MDRPDVKRGARGPVTSGSIAPTFSHRLLGMDVVTIIGIAGRGRAQRGRSPNHEEPRITPSEARLLTLRPASAAIVAPARPLDLPEGSSPRSRPSARAYVEAAFWLVVLAVFGIGVYVIDQGGHAVAPRSDASTLFATGSGRMPVTVTAGDVTVRVVVRSSAVPWFWCLESSRGLPPDQHLCRNSSETAPALDPIATDGVVHLDAASVQDADFLVQMYCRDACDWRVETERGLP